MTYLVVMLGFILFFLTMAIGVMMGMKPIAGSCGGLAQVGLNGECKVCGKTPGSCDPATLEKKSSINPEMTIDAAKRAKVDTLANRLNRPRYRDPLDF